MKQDLAEAYRKRLSEVPGYFSNLDAQLFIDCCREQEKTGIKGDLLEIGVWYGRSAILTGYFKNDTEHLHVNDLFGQLPTTETGQSELKQAGPIQLPTTTDFLNNYHRFHNSDPEIHKGPSTELVGALQNDAFRFIHIDGSHTQEAVEHDISLAKSLLIEGGIVVFDDFANSDHIGVAAALWPALTDKSLVPFASTPSKLYATTCADRADLYRLGLVSLTNKQDILTREQTANHSKILTFRQKFSRAKWFAKRLRRLTPFR